MKAETKPITVLAVDDHPVYREGVAAIIRSQPDFALAAQATSGQEAIEQYERHRPDVVIMDIQMPGLDGIAATARICEQCPDAKVIVLTTYKGDVQAVKALRAGAVGYLLKIAAPQELVNSIRNVYRGRRQVITEVAMEIAEHAGDEMLSSREIEILQSAARGNANRKIADEYGIAEETVKSHMANLLAKLGATDRTHAVAIAIKRGILEI